MSDVAAIHFEVNGEYRIEAPRSKALVRSSLLGETAAAPIGTAHLGLPVLEREDREKGGVARLPTSFGMDYDDAKFFTILTELSRQWSGGVGVAANSGEERLGTPPPRRGWGM